jgi:microcystin-dependent protein
MSSPFVGQLLLVPYNFAPKGWTFASGQIISISQNTALFSLLGTTYGGNGQTTFALPDLRGRVPIGQGQAPGLQNYDLGQVDGVETITLLTTEMPAHTHAYHTSNTKALAGDPNGGVLANNGSGPPPTNSYAPAGSSFNQTMSPNTVRPAGGNLPHENMAPYLTLNWIIALQGVFPPRS